MSDYKLHCGEKNLYLQCLQAFRTAETWKRYIKNCFRINDKQTIKMTKKVNKLDSKVTKEK